MINAERVACSPTPPAGVPTPQRTRTLGEAPSMATIKAPRAFINRCKELIAPQAPKRLMDMVPKGPQQLGISRPRPRHHTLSQTRRLGALRQAPWAQRARMRSIQSSDSKSGQRMPKMQEILTTRTMETAS